MEETNEAHLSDTTGTMTEAAVNCEDHEVEESAVTDGSEMEDLESPSVESSDESDDGTEPDEAEETREITNASVTEAILFASDGPLAGSKIAKLAGVGDGRDVRKHVASLNEKYAEMGLSFRIEEVAGGYQMFTLPAYNTWVSKLHKARSESKLSQAALETLAIIAYKQPVLRVTIESIRGVAAGEMINRLRELGLVKIVGRAEELGRPMLYGTTRKFLEVFGLGSLDDLPLVEELKPPEP